MMKILAVAIASLVASTLFLDTAWASRKRSGYKKSQNTPSKVNPKKQTTSVKSHARTSPNNTKADNWSTIGNINPYTGKKGTKRP
jgi:hypothetical protein